MLYRISVLMRLVLVAFMLIGCEPTPPPAIDPEAPQIPVDVFMSPLSRGLGGFESPLYGPETSRGLTIADEIVFLSYLSYLPNVYGPPPPTPTPVIRPTSTPVPCNMNPLALEFARLLVMDPAQQRPELRCSPSLARAAQRRAEDMAKRNYFSHTDPDGVTPNVHAKRAGCALPVFYGEGNSIESLVAGSPSAKTVFDALMLSPSHRPHLMGELDFYRNQGQFAIGMAVNEDATYRYYWVVMIGICEEERGLHFN